MSKPLNINEISIVIVAKNHNPTILNPDFLKYNEIVPEDWELAEAPICVEPMAQVTFKNGINIVSQLDKVIFGETIQAKNTEKVEVPSIARKYVETLPHVDYRAVGINPKGHVEFDSGDKLRKYLIETFLAPGPWSNIGEAPVKTSFKFVYSLAQSLCNLTIDEAVLQIPNKPPTSVLLFAANFHHELIKDKKEERLSELYEIVENWQNDLKTFKEIANKILIEKEVT